ncbi:MAG: mechanosensitive ion channel family protein [Ignavibacteria bacterium]|nr:mechanosensitive ion channel family protein [Ignavibacteria bacterium]
MKLLSIYNFLENLVKDLILVDIIIAVIIIVGAVLFGKLVNIISRLILKPIFKKTKSKLDDRILELIIKSDNRIFSVLGLYLGANYFTQRIKSETGLKKLLSVETYNFLISASDVVFNILFIAAVIISIYIISKIFNIVMDYYVEKKNLEDTRGTLQDFIPLLRKVFLIILIVIGVLIVLNKFNVNVSGIIVSLGVGSLAIALAAQETLSNMIAGFVILIDRPFREGDRIKLPSGEFGDVYEIGMRSTKILDFDNNLVIIPNAELVKSRIQNITYPNYISRVFVDVDIAYDADFDLAKNILIEIAKSHPLTLQEFEPQVYVTGFSQNGISLRLVSRTADYRNVYDMQSNFREAIIKKFAEHKIEIPYHQVVVRKRQE